MTFKHKRGRRVGGPTQPKKAKKPKTSDNVGSQGGSGAEGSVALHIVGKKVKLDALFAWAKPGGKETMEAAGLSAHRADGGAAAAQRALGRSQLSDAKHARLLVNEHGVPSLMVS